ncbi:MAG: outer membrane beta-barrel protein [Chlorobiaceae bacterium]|nr:outer membrane beta-barrel protein [Chlorobiaceae bacterium]
MNVRLAFLVIAMLLFRHSSAVAVGSQPESFTGIAWPCKSGVKINGPSLGDADYDISRTKGGKVSLKGEKGSLVGRAVYQGSGLDFQGSTFSVFTLSADGMLECRNADGLVFRPYISSGLSYATIDVERLGMDADDTAFILQFGAGVGIQLSPLVIVDARYRYIHPFDRLMQVDALPVRLDSGTHNLLIGMRFMF